MENPFTSILHRLESIEKLLLELKAEQAKTSCQEKEVLPVTGDVNLAVSITGLKRSTIYKMTSTGSIPFSKPSGKIIFVTKDLLQWIKKGNSTATYPISLQRKK